MGILFLEMHIWSLGDKIGWSKCLLVSQGIKTVTVRLVRLDLYSTRIMMALVRMDKRVLAWISNQSHYKLPSYWLKGEFLRHIRNFFRFLHSKTRIFLTQFPFIRVCVFLFIVKYFSLHNIKDFLGKIYESSSSFMSMSPKVLL